MAENRKEPEPIRSAGPPVDPTAAASGDMRPVSEELRRQRQERIGLYASLLENLPAYIICKDVEGRIIYVNEKFAARLNRRVDEIVGRTDADLYPPATAARYRAEDMHVMSHGQLLDDVVIEAETADTPIYFKVRKAPLKDVDGTIVGIQAIFWDVTRQRKAETAHENERKMLRTILDHMPDFVYVKDMNGCYVVVNKASQRALGADSMQEVIGKSSRDLLSSEMGLRLHEDDMHVLRTEEPLIGREQQLEDESGAVKWFLTTKVPLRDEHAKLRGLVGIDRDITELKATEGALRLAKESADSANQAKSDFLANMSHEIRTPLNAIIGMTDLVLKTELKPTQREYMQMVQQSGEALLMLINDILDFSKIEAGKFELDPADCDLSESLGDTLKSLAIRAAEKGIELAYRVDPDVPYVVHADLGRLRQVVVNLVGNAIKFTNEGEVLLSISKQSETDSSVELLFCVQDTGIGIPADKCETIFQEFEQADTSTTRQFGGTGLGLAISSRLIELMGGRIWVESEVGKGSRFYFTAKLGTLTDNSSEHPDWESHAFGDSHVLVVDDSEISREILCEMLTNWGIRSTLVPTAHEALQILRQAAEADNPYSIVIADRSLKDGDSTDLFDKIRSDQSLGNPETILLSAVPLMETNATDSAPTVECLSKPVKQSELFDAIAVAIDGAQTLTVNMTAETSAYALAQFTPQVLLAEDNTVNQKLALGALESLGCIATLAENGRSAVDISGQQEFDVILMDVQMPELDGLAATREIRQREVHTNTHVPIVAMTAHAMAGDRELCLAAGMDDYLSKPIRLDSLRDKLIEVLDIRGDDRLTESLTGTESPDPADTTQPPESPNIPDSKVPDSKVPDSSPPASHGSMVDWDHAKSGVANNEMLLQTVLQAFLGDYQRLVDDLRSAWQAKDAVGTARAAHSLKGSLLFLAAKPPIELAESIELDAANQQLDENSDRIDQLSSLIHAVVAEVHARSNNT